MNKPPAGFRGPAAQLTNGDLVSVARTPDRSRARRRNRRALDRHLQPLPALVLVDYDPWHRGHLDLGVAERDALGQRIAELRDAGHRLHDGTPVDAGWLAAQLWDLADLLGVSR